MKYLKETIRLSPALTVLVSGSCFEGFGGVKEWHVMVTPEESLENFSEQLNAVHKAFELWLKKQDTDKCIFVFRRYFLGDAANQQEILCKSPDGRDWGVVSMIQQPPVNRSKVALWIYFQEIKEVKMDSTPYRHYWFSRPAGSEGNAELQAWQLLESYQADLESRQCSIADHCIRTWLFVRDIDINYAGVVKARKEFFKQHGLTEQSHYIASTGIEGRTAGARSCVSLDGYAVAGLVPQQIRYLQALTHLNPTWEYGVTFERGVSILYGDRRQAYISGTASIGNKGEIIGLGDVTAQVYRMWENVAALLKEGGYDFEDVAQMIVYLRDIADYPKVKKLFGMTFPDIPVVFLWAPVCRPGWLVEMECMAIREQNSPDFAVFS